MARTVRANCHRADLVTTGWFHLSVEGRSHPNHLALGFYVLIRLKREAIGLNLGGRSSGEVARRQIASNFHNNLCTVRNSAVLAHDRCTTALYRFKRASFSER